uniref:Alkaline ceramidase n=1 Tax=Varanus komodoensis TaxID=61221 RepID=A0A8D2JFQ6_VARKO
MCSHRNAKSLKRPFLSLRFCSFGGESVARMPSIFAYQSAEVDWCERNFEHSENIAEYYNTYSSIIFFILSPVILKLNVDYVNYRPEPLRCFSVMQMLIGLFSIYFHMTLSYVGQLLDELSILWGLSVCYGCWFPPRYFPGFIKNREQFLWLLAVMTILCTFLSFVKPVFNAYLLNCIALHLFYMTYLDCNNPRVHHLAVSMAILWGIAISCWLVDKLLCGFCQKINFTYFHSLCLLAAMTGGNTSTPDCRLKVLNPVLGIHFNTMDSTFMLQRGPRMGRNEVGA